MATVFAKNSAEYLRKVLQYYSGAKTKADTENQKREAQKAFDYYLEKVKLDADKVGEEFLTEMMESARKSFAAKGESVPTYFEFWIRSDTLIIKTLLLRGILEGAESMDASEATLQIKLRNSCSQQ